MANPLKDELRIALVMNGGVSLAVWIGGVTCEFARLVAAGSGDNNPYAGLLDLLGVEPRIDVIAGTSAGGVNGAYLGLALSRMKGAVLARQIEDLRQVWIDDGAIGDLLRDPAVSDAPALLDGDGYYHQRLLQAFAAIDGAPGASAAAASEPALDVVLTATLLSGEPQYLADDYGTSLSDISHRGHFHFRRREADDPQGGIDQFAGALAVQQLALAARSTSSFPGAFEPSFAPIRGKAPDTGQLHPCGRPYMDGVANFSVSRYLIDGGVLDNKPLDVALECIFNRRADRPARRVLAYVVPYPGAIEHARPDTPEAMPGILPVLAGATMGIPGVQSISSQIHLLQDHNANVRRQRRSRTLITRYAEPPEIDHTARTFFKAYRDARAERALDDIIQQISMGLSREEGQRSLGKGGRKAWLHKGVFALRDKINWLPDAFPEDGDGPTLLANWQWGSRVLDYLARLALDLLVRREKLHLGPLGKVGGAAGPWPEISAILAELRQLRSGKDYWQKPDVVAVLRKELDDGDTLALGDKDYGWLLTLLNAWRLENKTREAELAERIARFVWQLAGEWASVSAGRSTPAKGEPAADLAGLIGYFRRGDDPAQEAAQQALVLVRLLRFAIVDETLGGGELGQEEEVEFIQISGDDDDMVAGGKLKAMDKLTGTQLWNFGGFYKASWRANDWLWGRRDAVPRILRVLLDPARLRRVAQAGDPLAPVAWLCSQIEAWVLGFAADPQGPNPQDQAIMAGIWQRGAGDLAKELAYVGMPSAIAPENLPVLVQLLSECFELDILRAELPVLAKQIRMDRLAKTDTSPAALSLADDCDPVRVGQRPGLALAAKWASGRNALLGTDRLAAEAGTDRASFTLAKALAGAVNTLQSGLGRKQVAGKAIATLRAPSLLSYGIARNLLIGSNTAVAINTGLTVAAVAVLIFYQLVWKPAIPLAIAVLVTMVMTLVVWAKRGWMRWLLYAGIFAGVAGGILAVWENVKDALGTTPGQIALGEGAVIGLWLLAGVADLRGRFTRWRQARQAQAALEKKR